MMFSLLSCSNNAASVIVIVEISRSAHNVLQLIQAVVAGNLKPWQFANWMFGGGGAIFCTVPDQSEVHFVHLYVPSCRKQRRCGFCG
jgi:hypothetical protein